jgi:hypothetical protein
VLKLFTRVASARWRAVSSEEVLSTVQLGDVPVPSAVVVVGVENELARERRRREVAVGAERERQKCQFARASGILHRRYGRPRAELRHERGEAVGSAPVGDHDVVVCLEEQPGRGRTDLPLPITAIFTAAAVPPGGTPARR